MYKINICTFQFDKGQLEAKTHGPENNINRRKTTTPSISVEKTIDKVNYKSKLVSVQRLINIRIVKVYSTVSNEALCIITGLTHIAIKIEELFQLYQLTRGSKKMKLWSIATWNLNSGISPGKQ